jgi:WhiB family redox-sensing transcriptional regulator
VTRHHVEVRLATAPVNPAAGEGLPSVPEWTERAACATVGHPDLWFADPNRWNDTLTAKRICHACKVQAECLDAALDAGSTLAGVWGGTTENERRTLRRKRTA